MAIIQRGKAGQEMVKSIGLVEQRTGGKVQLQ